MMCFNLQKPETGSRRGVWIVCGIGWEGAKSLWFIGCMIWSEDEGRMEEEIVESAGLINTEKSRTKFVEGLLMKWQGCGTQTHIAYRRSEVLHMSSEG